MMKNIAICLLLMVVAFLTGRSVVKAQSGPSVIWASGTLATCPVTFPVTAATGVLCVGNDHIGYAASGAKAFIQLDTPAAAAGVTSISFNGGTAKTGAVNFSLSTPTTTVNAN